MLWFDFDIITDNPKWRYKMNMQTMQLDVSSDIYDKVIVFFEIFPKDKIEIITKKTSKKYPKKIII